MTANPRGVASVASDLALTALFRPAEAVLLDGTYLATVNAATAAAGRGLQFTLTVTPLEDGSARIDALTAEAFGQRLAW